MSHALVHELALPFYDLLADVEDRGLALLEALDKKLPGTDFLADVVLDLGVVPAAGHEVFVNVADAEMRNLFVVGGDGEVVTVAHHENFRGNVLIVVREKGATGSGFETRNPLQSVLNILNGLAGTA
jgi:hypothetical protein